MPHTLFLSLTSFRYGTRVTFTDQHPDKVTDRYRPAPDAVTDRYRPAPGRGL